MSNNALQHICENMDYQTYSNLKNFFVISGIGGAFVNHFLLTQYPALNTPTLALSAISFAIAWSMTLYPGVTYTKDIKSIKEIYQEFLNKYKALNQIFNFNDPIEIYTMFQYLLWKGYLSIDKKFDFADRRHFIDMQDLYGVNVISGNAVCRHISSMLTDILNHSGINAWNLVVYSKVDYIYFHSLEQPKYTKEELIEWAKHHSPNDYIFQKIASAIEDFVENRKQNIELSSCIEDAKNPIEEVVGNHVITFAVKNKKSYFLDPTKIRTYRICRDNQYVLYDDRYGRIPIKLLNSIAINDEKNCFDARKNLSLQYPSISLEEEQQLAAEVLKICEENRDIFDQFYSENSELYHELSNKVLTIRKPKSTSKSL